MSFLTSINSKDTTNNQSYELSEIVKSKKHVIPYDKKTSWKRNNLKIITDLDSDKEIDENKDFSMLKDILESINKTENISRNKTKEINTSLSFSNNHDTNIQTKRDELLLEKEEENNGYVFACCDRKRKCIIF